MKRYVIANWKMYISSPDDAKKIFKKIDASASKAKGVEVIVCPPAFFVSELKRGYRGKVRLGAQDVFFESKGPWTGNLSPDMAKSVGATYTIVGHSERRALGDDESVVERKLRAALFSGLSAILCVGERERDHGGDYFTFIERELTSALKTVAKKDLKRLLIAYEPIFAIGKSAEEALAPPAVEEMAIFIRKTLAHLYDPEVAKHVPILYGGSVESMNAGALANTPGISGFLVGHASVVPEDFDIIIGACRI